MKSLCTGRPAFALGIGLMVLLSSGCTVTGGGYGYGGPAFGLGYYQTGGVAYGGWGRNYYVGPPRPAGYRPPVAARPPPPRGGRGAPPPRQPPRPTPSIPTGPRPGPGGYRP